ncbi:hypothetical protein J6590_017519 [Homalodisca vitripennis]|nr:hypothetical protein J6590_017519 [Homalodisca vitripennis]
MVLNTNLPVEYCEANESTEIQWLARNGSTFFDQLTGITSVGDESSAVQWREALVVALIFTEARSESEHSVRSALSPVKGICMFYGIRAKGSGSKATARFNLQQLRLRFYHVPIKAERAYYSRTGRRESAALVLHVTGVDM